MDTTNQNVCPIKLKKTLQRPAKSIFKLGREQLLICAMPHGNLGLFRKDVFLSTEPSAALSGKHKKPF